jgi:hypothetical protein
MMMTTDMAELTKLSMEAALTVAVSQIAGGVQKLITLKPAARQKLKAVYLEIRSSLNAMKPFAVNGFAALSLASPDFTALVKNLSNRETAGLYNDITVIRRGLPVKGFRKGAQYRRVQYALNYTVCGINDLKDFVKNKTKPGPAVRLSVRLKTLHRHLVSLETILRRVKG